MAALSASPSEDYASTMKSRKHLAWRCRPRRYRHRNRCSKGSRRTTASGARSSQSRSGSSALCRTPSFPAKTGMVIGKCEALTWPRMIANRYSITAKRFNQTLVSSTTRAKRLPCALYKIGTPRMIIGFERASVAGESPAPTASSNKDITSPGTSAFVSLIRIGDVKNFSSTCSVLQPDAAKLSRVIRDLCRMTAGRQQDRQRVCQKLLRHQRPSAAR